MVTLQIEYYEFDIFRSCNVYNKRRTLHRTHIQVWFNLHRTRLTYIIKQRPQSRLKDKVTCFSGRHKLISPR